MHELLNQYLCRFIQMKTDLLTELEAALKTLENLHARGKAEQRSWMCYMVNAVEYVRVSVETERRRPVDMRRDGPFAYQKRGICGNAQDAADALKEPNP